MLVFMLPRGGTRPAVGEGSADSSSSISQLGGRCGATSPALCGSLQNTAPPPARGFAVAAVMLPDGVAGCSAGYVTGGGQCREVGRAELLHYSSSPSLQLSTPLHPPPPPLPLTPPTPPPPLMLLVYHSEQTLVESAVGSHS